MGDRTWRLTYEWHQHCALWSVILTIVIALHAVSWLNLLKLWFNDENFGLTNTRYIQYMCFLSCGRYTLFDCTMTRSVVDIYDVATACDMSSPSSCECLLAWYLCIQPTATCLFSLFLKKPLPNFGSMNVIHSFLNRTNDAMHEGYYAVAYNVCVSDRLHGLTRTEA